VAATYIPQRGDIVWIQLNPQSGHEQAGHRPALVVSPGRYNQTVGLALLCPISTQVKGYPFEVILPPGLKSTGAVLADQVKSVDWRARQAAFLCSAPDDVLDELLERINVLLDPPER
jgi:mRNA interferase MazF